MTEFRQQVLRLASGSALDAELHAPPGCTGDLESRRPCPRTLCRGHTGVRNDEPNGRPHPNGKRPSVRLDMTGSTCVYDEIASQPDGLTADDIAPILGIGSGERVRQVEHRGALKMEGVEYWRRVIDHALPAAPPGFELELFLPSNEHQLTSRQFVTLVFAVEPKKDRRPKAPVSGVMVRRKRK